MPTEVHENIMQVNNINVCHACDFIFETSFETKQKLQLIPEGDW